MIPLSVDIVGSLKHGLPGSNQFLLLFCAFFAFWIKSVNFAELTDRDSLPCLLRVAGKATGLKIVAVDFLMLFASLLFNEFSFAVSLFPS